LLEGCWTVAGKLLEGWKYSSLKKIRSQRSVKNVINTSNQQKQPDWKFTDKNGGVS